MNLKDLLPSVDIMSCGCKGIRVCSLCIDSERVKRLGASASSSHNHLANFNCYVYKDGCAFLDTQLNYHSTTSDVVKSLSCLQVADHDNATSFPIDGIAVLHDFLSYDEEEQIVISMDSDEWLLSQSGRRKQDYGPRVNFKHKKVKCDRFVGVPDYADLILNRLKTIDAKAFGDYTPFELCNLEYNNERHSSIELHQDDKWIWGERLISLNLLSGSIMTFENAERKALVFVSLPRRSLMLFRGEARYIWRHGIFPWHIEERRIALTMREAGKDFLEGGEKYEEFGKELLKRSQTRLKKLAAHN